MAIPTVYEAINEAAFHLGDQSMRRFNSATLGLAVGMAWRETIGEMLKCQDSAVELQVLYTLPAGTLELLPATAAIENFGALVRIEERPSGAASIAFFPVSYTEILPLPWSPTNRLIYYSWRNNRFYFNETTQDIQLRITYLSSGQLPSLPESTLGIDNCLTVVGKLAAAIAGPTKGLKDIPQRLRNEVYHDPNDMQTLIQPTLVMQQERRVQMAAYAVGSNRRRSTGQYPFFGP